MPVAIIVESSEFLDNLPDLPSDILLEFRIDLDHSLLEKISDYRENHDIIATLRSKSEGGGFTGNREEILNKILEFSPKFIDLEFDTDKRFIETTIEAGSIPVVSKHDYSQPMRTQMDEFIRISENIQGSDEIVVKFVGKPVDAYDMLKSLEHSAKFFPRRVILGIGRHGNIARTLRDDFNQEFVFGSTKIGPIPEYSDLINTNLPDAINSGLIGKELSHSLSPEIHKILRDIKQLPGFYHLLDVHQEDNLIETVNLLSKTSLKGVNVTFPYKSKIKHLTTPDQWVELADACNTLRFVEKEIKSYNTDISGFMTYFEILEDQSQSSLNNILIFGAGGAARAVAIGLSNAGKSITIVNRSEERKSEFSDQLLESVEFFTLDKFEDKLDFYDVYINATSVGYHDISPADLLPIPKSVLLVIDLNYGTNETILVRDAINMGIKAVDGKGMLFHQAVDAFELWTGKKIDRDTTFETFLRTF